MSARARTALTLLIVAWMVAAADLPHWTLLIALALSAQAMRMVHVDLIEHGVRGGEER